MTAFEAQKDVSYSPSVIDIAYHVVFWCLRVREENLIEVMSIAYVDNRAAVNTFLIHWDQEERNSFVFWSVGSCPTKNEDPVSCVAA